MRTALFVLFLLGASISQSADCWSIGRLQYSGGGDWYADASSLPNLIQRVKKDLHLNICPEEKKIELLDPQLYQIPFLYLTGHGNILFSDAEVQALGDYLYRGGFLLVDDNFGLDSSFRREIKKVFPKGDLKELSQNHSVFYSHYFFPKGLPKIHEHLGKRPQLWGLDLNGRLVALYSYESDLGDGWEDASVHNVPSELREYALRMGVNIMAWFMQGQPLK